MQVEFKLAIIPDDLRRLHAFDRKVFPPSDVFPMAHWRAYESWWMVVAGKNIGCCAFQLGVDFQEDIYREDDNPPQPGTLYIASTGIHPAHQGRGLGRLLKSWQVAYAQHHGFSRIVTNTRSRNRAMIALNRSFGFEVIRKTRGYYSDPTDATTVMELKL